jgi:hypothetical protein
MTDLSARGAIGADVDAGLPGHGLPDHEVVVVSLGRIRVSTCLAPLVAISCGLVAGGTVPTIRSSLLVLLIAILTLSAVAQPDSYAGLLLVFAISAFWAVTVPDRLSPFAIPAALSVLVLHTSLASSTTSPVDRPTPAVRRRWRHRTIVVGAVAAAVWLATRAFGAANRPAGVVLPFVAFAFIALIAWFVRERSQPAGPRPPSAWDERPVVMRSVDELSNFP